MGMLLLEAVKAAAKDREAKKATTSQDMDDSDDEECKIAVANPQWPEDLPVKNGFIHFSVPRSNATEHKGSLPRQRTAPAATLRSSMVTCASKAPGSTASVVSEENSSDVEEPSTPSSNPNATAAMEEKATWHVDARKLRSRDTRVCTTLRPRTSSGLESEAEDFVVTIYASSVSQKRGGSHFKAADGKGKFQIKCNGQRDKELAVRITVGPGSAAAPKWSCCQKHNFSKNSFLQFHDQNGKEQECRFLDFVESFVDHVTVIMEICAAEDAESWFDNQEDVTAEAIEEQASWTSPFASPRGGTSEGTPCQTTDETAMPSPVSRDSPVPQSVWPLPGGAVIFQFTIRRADGVELGMEVVPNYNTQELEVKKVLEDGAVIAWNRLCTGPSSVKAVMPGDRVVSVNDLSGCCDRMLAECKDKQLLKLVVVRGECVHCCETWHDPVAWVPVAVPICAPFPYMQWDDSFYPVGLGGLPAGSGDGLPDDTLTPTSHDVDGEQDDCVLQPIPEHPGPDPTSLEPQSCEDDTEPAHDDDSIEKHLLQDCRPGVSSTDPVPVGFGLGLDSSDAGTEPQSMVYQ